MEKWLVLLLTSDTRLSSDHLSRPVNRMLERFSHALWVTSSSILQLHRIVNISQDVLVNEGDNVNLFCLAVGRPEPTVTWKDQKSAATPGLAHSHACHRHPLFIVSITVTHYLNRTGA
ncbi:hypothetical protein CRUP_000865 [Coryphaenoides rupestris]|nr:hypothetical protein CRUP_000865 [Coryphaenoides rupestris]